MEQYILGIDVGTTGTKTLLFSAVGDLLGHAYRSYETSAPQVGYSEQDPEDWWRAVCETVREVCAAPDVAEGVAAISLSLQGGTVVPVDEELRAVRPAIVWNDLRCGAQREAYLKEVGDAKGMYEMSGWQLDPQLPALQIRWMRDNEPELFAKTDMFLTVPDYISKKMTGIAAVDLSDAGINQLCDIRRGCYDEKILHFAGITEAQLPKIVRSGDVIGNLTAQAAAELGLTTRAVLVAGAHDQYAVALGAGANKPGDILIGSGTAGVVTAIGDRPAFETGLDQSIAATPGMWGSLASLSSGGVCLEWWRKNLAVDGGEPVSYDAINEEVSRRKAAEDGLFFFPFSGRMNGEKDFQKGTFVGLDLAHDRYDLARAVMEGVVFQTRWMLERFQTKPSADGLKLSGGASKSPLWCSLAANITGLPIRIPAVADLACVGAAILAGVGCGIYRDAEEGYRALAVDEQVLQPDPEAVRRYDEWYAAYKKIAGALGAAYDL